MQLLHDLIGDLQRQRELIDERLRLAAELLNTYDPTDIDDNDLALGDEVVTLIAAPAKRPKAKKKPGKPEYVTCEDCGEGFHRNGIGPHRKAKHSAPAARGTQRDPLDTFDDEAFVCSTCNHEEPNLNGMKRHTMANHGRAPYDIERDPVAA